MSKEITVCPRCTKDFMYDPSAEMHLHRTGEIVICQDCDFAETTKRRSDRTSFLIKELFDQEHTMQFLLDQSLEQLEVLYQDELERQKKEPLLRTD